MKIIDTHCHIDFDEFAHDRDNVLDRARENGLCGFVIPGVKQTTWNALIALCNQSYDLHYALGMHPLFVQTHELQHIQSLQDCVEKNQPVAVGEIGLDFHDRNFHTEKQVIIFEQQLKLACNVNLPVILHVRKAHEEVLASLKKFPVVGGIVHAFNGSMQQVERYLSHNFKFGFGGMLTYQRSSKLRKLASELPIESIVLETDSPDMTVEQHRGERNSPEYLPYCLKALADIRDMTLAQLAYQTSLNACDVLRLKI